MTTPERNGVAAPDGGPAVSPHAAMLQGALERVGELDYRVRMLGSDLANIGGTVASLTNLAHEVTALHDLVRASMAQPEEDAAAGDECSVVDWSSLNRAEATEAWERLYAWLDGWLVPTYRVSVRQLPVCWPFHAAMREELSWLRTTWVQAYRRGPLVPAAAGAEWHTRWFPAALSRISGHAKAAGCSPGSHEEVPLSQWFNGGAPPPAADLSTCVCWLDAGRVQDVSGRPA